VLSVVDSQRRRGVRRLQPVTDDAGDLGHGDVLVVHALLLSDVRESRERDVS
jgi:hypothetical protein